MALTRAASGFTRRGCRAITEQRSPGTATTWATNSHDAREEQGHGEMREPREALQSTLISSCQPFTIPLPHVKVHLRSYLVSWRFRSHSSARVASARAKGPGPPCCTMSRVDGRMYCLLRMCGDGRELLW